MRPIKLAAAIAGLIALAACGQSGTVPATLKVTGVQHGTVSAAGLTRTYRLFVPPGLDPARQAPVVVMLHGCFPGVSADLTASALHFDELATRAGFVAAYPEGMNGCWNSDPTCCGQADDVAFVNALLDRVESELPINRSRVFVAGGSGGAKMAYRLACELSSRIRAIASIPGYMLTADCRPSRPVSVLEMHGTADRMQPYAGGGPYHAPAVEDTARRWAALDGCAGAPTTTENGITTTMQWRGCRQNSAVRLDTVAGGRHTWFGCGTPPCAPVPGEPDANTTLWDFFSSLR